MADPASPSGLNAQCLINTREKRSFCSSTSANKRNREGSGTFVTPAEQIVAADTKCCGTLSVVYNQEHEQFSRGRMESLDNLILKACRWASDLILEGVDPSGVRRGRKGILYKSWTIQSALVLLTMSQPVAAQDTDGRAANNGSVVGLCILAVLVSFGRYGCFP